MNNCKDIDIYKIIAVTLKRLREEEGISALAFSKKIGMHRNLYQKIEKAQGEYYLSSLHRVINYYPGMTFFKFFQIAGL